jgi:hypothetical protein
MTDSHHNTDFNLPSPIAEGAESPSKSPTQTFFPPSAPPPNSASQLSPIIFGVRRGSAPDSRRGSQSSITGTSGYGGLPPPEPQINPRRGSATGSYGLPVPPEWIRAQAENHRRGSRAPVMVASGSIVGLSDSPTGLGAPSMGQKKGEEKRGKTPRPFQVQRPQQLNGYHSSHQQVCYYFISWLL